jgi:hypothetical protein
MELSRRHAGATAEFSEMILFTSLSSALSFEPPRVEIGFCY